MTKTTSLRASQLAEVEKLEMLTLKLHKSFKAARTSPKSIIKYVYIVCDNKTICNVSSKL